jgi:hypothetical protein
MIAPSARGCKEHGDRGVGVRAWMRTSHPWLCSSRAGGGVSPRAFRLAGGWDSGRPRRCWVAVRNDGRPYRCDHGSRHDSQADRHRRPDHSPGPRAPGQHPVPAHRPPPSRSADGRRRAGRAVGLRVGVVATARPRTWPAGRASRRRERRFGPRHDRAAREATCTRTPAPQRPRHRRTRHRGWSTSQRRRTPIQRRRSPIPDRICRSRTRLRFRNPCAAWAEPGPRGRSTAALAPTHRNRALRRCPRDDGRRHHDLAAVGPALDHVDEQLDRALPDLVGVEVERGHRRPG